MARLTTTVSYNIKEAIGLLVKKGYYANEAEFVAIAVNKQLAQDKIQSKFKWKEVERYGLRTTEQQGSDLLPKQTRRKNR